MPDSSHASTRYKLLCLSPGILICNFLRLLIERGCDEKLSTELKFGSIKRYNGNLNVSISTHSNQL